MLVHYKVLIIDMTTIKALIKRYPVLNYFILVFIISWGFATLIVGPSEIINIRATETEQKLPLVIMAMVIGPTLAGLLSIWLDDSKEGLKSLLSRLRKKPENKRWYLALLIAPASLVITDLLLMFFSPSFIPAVISEIDKLSFLGFTFFGALVGGFFEEIGWTGFVIPKMLKRLNIFKTGLLLGLIWGAWHFLVNFWGSAISSGEVPLVIYLSVALFSFLVPYRILMVWVYSHTNSLLLSILMHSSLITFWLAFGPTIGTGIFGVIWFLTWTIILWIMVFAINNFTKDKLTKNFQIR